MNETITPEQVKEFQQHPVWMDLTSTLREVIQSDMKYIVNEYRIDKIRELQGEIKALLKVLAHPRLLVEDIKEDQAREEELKKININVNEDEGE